MPKSKHNREVKRRAKLKALRTASAKLEQARADHIADAIMDMCAPLEYRLVNDIFGLDFDGRMHLWEMGMAAWNYAVRGLPAPEEMLDDEYVSTADEYQQGESLIVFTLMFRKYRNYPNLCTEVSGIRYSTVSGKPRLKVVLGDVLEPVEIPFAIRKREIRPTPKEIMAMMYKGGKTRKDAASMMDETEENVAAWEEGKMDLDEKKVDYFYAFLEPDFEMVDEDGETESSI